MKRSVLALAMCWAALTAARSWAITAGPFGPHGEGGTRNGQTLTIGPGGTVHDLDAFLAIGGFDLNGNLPGTAAALSRDALPAGLSYQFSSALSAGATDLTLDYTFANTTGTAFSNVVFLAFLDAEIDPATNTFFNEYGTVSGTVGHGPADGAPDQWQIDEPGFQAGSIYRNLYLGALNNSNSIPQSATNDVSLALGFNLGTLWPGTALSVHVLLSEAGHSRSTLALQHHDLSSNSPTLITFSGEADLLASIAGTIFRDANRNGAVESGEGLAGVTVFADLNQSGVRTASNPQATTGGDGSYRIGNLASGQYLLRVDTNSLPGGTTNSLDPDGVLNNATTVALAANQALTNRTWGYQDVTPPAQFTNLNGMVKLGLVWRLNRPTGSLIGTLHLTNAPASGVGIKVPFQLSFPTSTNYYYVHPTGTLSNGLPYLDLSTLVTPQLSASGELAPGGSVSVDGIEIYSRDRSAPSNSLFVLWATRVQH